MSKPVFRTHYENRISFKQDFKKPSLAKKSFKESCDINFILSKYQRTGELPISRKPALYGDFSTVGDYLSSMQTIVKADEQFNGLDAKIRDRFNNDPARFLEFVHNKENYDEGVKLGIFLPKEAPMPKPEVKPEVKLDVQKEPQDKK